MQPGFGIVVLAGEAQIDCGRSGRRFFSERPGIPAPDHRPRAVRCESRSRQVVRVQVEDRLRAARVDLRQRLPVEVDVLADQVPRAVIFPQQRPARAVDVMRRIAPGDLLGALVVGVIRIRPHRDAGDLGFAHLRRSVSNIGLRALDGHVPHRIIGVGRAADAGELAVPGGVGIGGRDGVHRLREVRLKSRSTIFKN